MCLSTAYEEIGGEQRKVCEYVSGINADGERITLTDIMGVETVVFGSVKKMDFIKNVIVIEGRADA